MKKLAILKNALLATGAGGALAIGGAIGTANAQPTLQQLIQTYPIFQIEDNDVERINVDQGNNGILDVGDTLRGIVSFQQFIGFTGGQEVRTELDGVEANTVSAVFEIQALTKEATATPGRFNYTFGAYAPFATEFGLPAGSAVAVFEDPNNDVVFSGCSPTPGGSCEANVTDGDLELALGFGADRDDQWRSLDTPENTTLPTQFPVSAALGNFNFGLSVLFNDLGVNVNFDRVRLPPLLPTIDDGFVDWRGSGSVLGTQDAAGNQTTAYTITTDTDVEGRRAAPTPPVPEPATLGLFGIGLAGIGLLARRRKA